MTVPLDRTIVLELIELLTIWSTPYLVSDWRDREARRLLLALKDALAEADGPGIG